jgi:signal transduction histidine kinase
MKQAGIEINYSAPDAEIPLIPGDPERLKQVFTNVLDNASKHGHSDKIDVSLWEDKKQVHISFRDYGNGIPEDELPHVKEKFYKGSSKNRGTGIGLAVCDEIITRHNGTLDIRNAEGGGCKVTISLPMSSD